MKRRFLFYLTHNYSFEILRPLQEAIISRGDSCAWFAASDTINLKQFNQNEQQLHSVKKAIQFNPDAVFVPGNIVPNFIPGSKIAIFHGLEYKKNGFFRIRDCFDLYCTPGRISTEGFKKLAEKHKNFHVIETGWTKLDPLFNTQPISINNDLPIVLYAPTFSKSLTSIDDCFKTIQTLIEKQSYFWLIKFHPKTHQSQIDQFKAIKAKNLKIIEDDKCLPALRTADVMLSDTSSMIGEFLVQAKPVVTYKNAQPGNYLINIDSPQKIESAINTALSRPKHLIEALYEKRRQLHPYTDGKSSLRVLEATEMLLQGKLPQLKSRPANIYRNLKMRAKLGYWGF